MLVVILLYGYNLVSVHSKQNNVDTGVFIEYKIFIFKLKQCITIKMNYIVSK